MPAKIVPRDVNDIDALTAAVAAIEKKGGQVVQVLEVGQNWLIVHTAAGRAKTQVETR